jgi:hypothetical protein
MEYPARPAARSLHPNHWRHAYGLTERVSQFVPEEAVGGSRDNRAPQEVANDWGHFTTRVQSWLGGAERRQVRM